MKNTIKMSLVAAVAVAGLSTTASAGNLEEMIKDTTMSGKISVGYTSNTTDTTTAAGVKTTGAGTNNTEYDIDATIKTPVNDYITSTIGFQADHDPVIDNANNTRWNGGGNGIGGGDTQVDVTVANFTYKNGPVTAIVGKQGVATPFTDDEKGDGILAMGTMGPVTLAAAHFVNSNTDLTAGELGITPQGDQTINAVAAIGSMGGITVDAWYVTTTLIQSATIDGAAAWTIGASGTIADMISLNVRHSSAEIDGAAGANFDAETLTKAVVGVNLGMVSLTAGYGMTNDTIGNGVSANNTIDGTYGRVHGVEWNPGDTDAGFTVEQAELDALNDADAFLIGASATFADVTAGVTYIDGDFDANGAAAGDDSFDELLLSVGYKMSKNFSIDSYYSMFEVDSSIQSGNNDIESDEFNVALTYKF
jgi:hypothetical protein